MRNVTAYLLAGSIVVLAGCGLFGKKDGDAGTDAMAEVVVDAGAAVAAPVVASNAGAVARFAATEVPASEGRKIASTTQVRSSPKAGAVVATLGVNTDVTRIAINGTDSLITFANPTNPADTLMGWVTDQAFTAYIAPRKVDAGVVDAGPAPVVVVDAGPAPVVVVDAGPPPFSCPSGQSPVALSATKNVCKKSCTKQEDCKNKICSPALSPTKTPVKVCLAE